MHDKTCNMENVSISTSPEQLAMEERNDNSACAFRLALERESFWAAVPLLNYTPLHQLNDMSVIRFRGMIQDMLDPEIYLERYEVISTDSGSKRTQEGKYRDCLVTKAGEEVDFDAPGNVQGERRTLFVVSLPGINAWTQAYEAECNWPNSSAQHTVTADRAVSSGQKRAAPDTEGEAMDIDAMAGSAASSESTHEPNKRRCADSAAAAKDPAATPFGADYLLNSPIPERPGKACLVKVYSDFDSYTLNSIVDVVGFLSVDPALDGSTIDMTQQQEYDNAAELQAQHPPPSLIPRIHAIAVHKLPHPNPLLDARLLPAGTAANAVATADSFNMLAVQKDLRMLLTLCLFNDDLAADYLLSHLISTVYSRAEMESIGKFTLNISNLPRACVAANYTQSLYEILELLMPASHYLPMSLETMNTAAFVPKKDYETNKLVSGMLQLAPHTHLILDETRLQQGKLEAAGVLNIQSVAHLINRQQIKCDFKYYQIDYNADIPVLVLSEGKSMLPSDFMLPIKTDAQSVELIAETLKAAHHYLQPGRLDQFRRFLTKAKTCSFDMDHTETQMIQADFVEMRKANAKTNVDDLHALLVLSRLLAIAEGKRVFAKEYWQLAKDMEAKRRLRIQELPGSKLCNRA